jgi:hypothetical protein
MCAIIAQLAKPIRKPWQMDMAWLGAVYHDREDTHGP